MVIIEWKLTLPSYQRRLYPVMTKLWWKSGNLSPKLFLSSVLQYLPCGNLRHDCVQWSSYSQLIHYRKHFMKKIMTFDSGNHLNMWVTFVVFTCNRMVKLKMASKRSGLAILMITIWWGNWNASPHAGTFHMTFAVLYYEITERNAFVLVELL